MPVSEQDWNTLLEAVRRALSSAESAHDWDHTLRVLGNGERLLALLPQADSSLVRCAILLHDIARPQEDASCGRVCHALAGAETAAGMLKECASLTPAEREKIVSAIRTHRYRGENIPQTLEEKIVYDADKLDSLGAIGIGRAFLFAGHCGARLHNTRAEALAGTPYGKEDTAYREFLVKLQKLPGRLFTEEGRKMAEERLAYMEGFFRRLELEICGNGTQMFRRK